MIHRETIKIPGGLQISKSFLDKFDSLFKKDKRWSEKLRKKIVFNYSDGSFDEFKDFSEFNLEIIGENIKKVSIRYYNYSPNFLVLIELDSESSITKEIIIESEDRNETKELKEKIIKIFNENKLGYSWLYSKKNIYLYLISFFITILLGFFIYNVFQINKLSNRLDLIAVLSFPFLILFISLINKIFYWIYPIIEFKFHERIADNKKTFKYFLGVVVLGLFVNAFWKIIEVLIK